MKLNTIVLAGLAVCACATTARAQPTERLSTFADIMKTLKTGGTVRAVFNYKQCKLMSLKTFTSEPKDESETNDPSCELTIQNKPQTCYYAEPESMDAIGGLQINTWEYFGPGFLGPKAYVSTSDAKLISIRGFVLNYGSVKIYDDNSVVVKVNYLKTANDIPANPTTQRDVPLTVRRDATGATTIISKKLAMQEHVITMDEMFTCSMGESANFFAAP